MKRKLTDLQKAKRSLRKSRQRTKALEDAIRWCLAQNWSYGNHGPEGVPGMLREALDKKNQKYFVYKADE